MFHFSCRVKNWKLQAIRIVPSDLFVAPTEKQYLILNEFSSSEKIDVKTCALLKKGCLNIKRKEVITCQRGSVYFSKEENHTQTDPKQSITLVLNCGIHFRYFYAPLARLKFFVQTEVLLWLLYSIYGRNLILAFSLKLYSFSFCFYRGGCLSISQHNLEWSSLVSQCKNL